MDRNLLRQLKHDFDISEDLILNGNNIFTYNQSNKEFIYYNQCSLAINCAGDSLLVRSSNKKLLDELEKSYKDYPAVWFMEFDNIRKLEEILTKHDMTVKNMGPLMTTSRDFRRIESTYEFTRLKKKDFIKFKGITKFAFAFDDDDRMALAYYDKDKLIAIVSASYNSKYLWEIGVEKFSYDSIYRNVASYLVNNLTFLVKKENPDVSTIYTTQFSHTKSINVAINAGYQFSLSLIAAD